MASDKTDFDVFTAALEGQANLLRTALDANPDLAKKRDDNSDGRTALHHAASTGSLDAVQVLLEHGADANATDGMGFTPLLSAVSGGHPAVVRTLIGGGADVKAANKKGLTSLHYAASKGRTEIGRVLIENGADVNARDSANQLPLCVLDGPVERGSVWSRHRAASIGSTPFVQLLTRPPPDADAPKPRLNLQDRAGNTPLHLAIESGHGEAAVALIEAGADRQRTNTDGERPEEILGVGGQEARRLLDYIKNRCGPLED